MRAAQIVTLQNRLFILNVNKLKKADESELKRTMNLSLGNLFYSMFLVFYK